MKKIWILSAVFVLIWTAACGSGGQAASPQASAAPYAASSNSAVDQYMESKVYDASFAEAATPEYSKAQMDGGYTSMAVAGELRPDKIIKSGTVELSTERFDGDKVRLESLTRETGGFIESSSVYNTGYNRRYEAVLRVPGERFADMKAAVEATGKLLSSNENAENVTGQYYDMEGRLKTKRVEEERILEMIEKAENVETLLTLEEYLGRVRTDIELLESQMKDIDSLSSYSTLRVYLTEGVNVKLMADTGNFGQRLWQSFKSSAGGTAAFFENVLVFLAGAAIPLALIALLVFIVITAYKKRNGFGRKERMGQ
ncbi:MAG: DUF4349 domain-containing protein [Clostridiales bacterium]|jgi:YD repeat-containing protein|nr:DUF4349 domain-containing protein [Clostridiales bacterium]